LARGLLKGRVAVVTGAGQGLGYAIATEYAEEGATVALLERNPEMLEKARTELVEKGGRRVMAYQLDVTDYDAYGSAVRDVVEKAGRVDVLVSNAAIARYGTILEDTLKDWRDQIAVNLEAVYMGAKLVAPHMVEQNFGRIVNISSVQGFISTGDCGPYNAAKGGIIAFTKSLAVELAPHNILANAIAPGFMRTPMSVIDGVDETQTEEFNAWYVEKRKVPMARTGYPEDVAGTAVFLASDYCRYMTGQLLVVDGGLTSTI
jgi:3-oxoacyl-[acyl-carrier protein] reductase